jgi:hypothetical protein
VSRADDLAWWTLLHATNGVAEEFLTAVTDHCIKKKLRFGSTVADLGGVPPKGPSTTSLNKAKATVAQTLELPDRLDIEKVPESPHGWATWLLETAEALKIPRGSASCGFDSHLRHQRSASRRRATSTAG